MRLAAVAAALGGPTVLAGLSANDPDGSALAKQYAAVYAEQTHGVIAFFSDSRLEAHGGPIHVSESNETAYVEVDGRPALKRVLRHVKDGKSDDAAGLKKLSADVDGPLSRFGLKPPYNLGALGDYTFARPREDGDHILIDFATAVKDQAHGDGTIVISKSAGRIDSVTLRPAALPPNADAMTIQVEFGAAPPDRWDIVKITRTFRGHQGPFGGGGSQTVLYERYASYPSEAAADEAVNGLVARQS